MVNKVSLYILIIVFSFIWGVVTIKEQIFPYRFFHNLALKTSTFTNNNEYKQQTSLHTLYSPPKEATIMLGDSITYGVHWNELLNQPDIINRGINGDTTSGILKRIPSVIKINPHKVFIMAGINDIRQNISINVIYKNYSHIIKTLKQNNITPYIQSTLYTKNKKNSSDIFTLNNMLMSLAAQENIIFIDLNSYMSYGKILKDSLTHDGVHLNSKGYKIWKKVLLQYI